MLARPTFERFFFLIKILQKKQRKCQKLPSTTRVYYKIQPYTWKYYETLHTYVLQLQWSCRKWKKRNNNKEKTEIIITKVTFRVADRFFYYFQGNFSLFIWHLTFAVPNWYDIYRLLFFVVCRCRKFRRINNAFHTEVGRAPLFFFQLWYLQARIKHLDINRYLRSNKVEIVEF